MISGNKIHTALTTWLKQKGQQGGSGFLEVTSDKDSNINMRWLNDSLAEVVIPPYAEVLRKLILFIFMEEKLPSAILQKPVVLT
ncbi:hypothetical protein [Cellulophaga sp. L1A9]|uniref:hypothetical protein n=1 Tax=Cellulophaga sp. L1A9 TaxID=2686362 RepID=UPI00131E9988|nr:hypothetical protein [Cellulophaga sp. L1A9]